MPHQCTDCGRAFEDGSKAMLSGCPDCGGNTFQFRPDGITEGTAPAAEPPDPPEPDSSVARTVGSAATAVRDFVGGSPSQDRPGMDDPAPDGPEPSTSDDFPTPEAPDGADPHTDSDAVPHTDTDAVPHTDSENPAQASARSDVVSPEDLPPAPEQPTRDRPAPVMDEPAGGDRPDLAELREELNEQFESIRVLEPGQYELNLMELFDREEYIIALQEDGKYTIQVPERWED